MTNRLWLPTLFLCVIAAATIIGRADPVAGNPGQRHTPFVTVLLRNWDRWDTNHDGVLSDDEIDRAVQDPAVKGDDAAAAGTLKLMSRDTDFSDPSLTRNFFAKYDKASLAGSDGTKPTTSPSTDSKIPFDCDYYFHKAQHRLAESGGAWPTTFSLDTACQGPLGDCFLVATIGSMIEHNPDAVNKLVSPQSDGTYRVTPPGASPFVLQPLTQSQLVIASTTGGHGDWLAVFEQSIGKFTEQNKIFADGEATDSISNGGMIGQTMSLLTGHKYTCVHIWMTIADRRDRAGTQLPLLRRELTAAIHENRAITAGVLSPELPPMLEALTAHSLPKLPPDISTRHAYAIIGYNAGTDVLEVWNPHGQQFEPKGPDSPENGYTTNHGRFKIPLKEAYSFFTDFIFETATPLPHGTAPRW